MSRPLGLRVALVTACLVAGISVGWRRDDPASLAAAPSSDVGLGVAPSNLERGRSLYVRGLRVDGTALLAEMASGEVVSAAELPCVGCHGPDGRGRAEGGARPSDVRLASLTRPYDVTEGTGRRRAPYEVSTIVRAVTSGLDSSGAPLNAAMPRYRLSREDAMDLMAYLGVLGHEPEPGLTDTVIRVGYLEPESSATPGEARAALSSFVDALHRSGGIYRRRVELVSARLPSEPADRPAAVRAFLERERPFVVIGLVVRREDRAWADLLETAHVPAIAALSEGVREEGRYLVPLFPSGAPAGMSGVQGVLASAAVLVEGLKRAGRELSRETLLAAIGGRRATENTQSDLPGREAREPRTARWKR